MDEVARLVDLAYDLLLVVDEGGMLRHVSGAARQLLGREPAELTGTDAAGLLHPDDLAHALVALGRRRDRVRTPRIVSRLRHADGSWVRLELTATDAHGLPDVQGLVISAREAVAEPGSDREGRAVQVLDTLLHHVGDGVLACGRDLDVTIMNRAMRTLVGLPPDHIQPLRVPAEVSFRPAGCGCGEGHDLLGRPLRGETIDGEEWVVRRADGSERQVRVAAGPVVDSGDAVFGSVTVFTDVTEQRRHEQDLLHLATHDALTGVANRRLLVERLQEVAAGGPPRPEPSAPPEPPGAVGRRDRAVVLLCDVDHFKEVNDTLGHDHGDQLLVELCRRLRRVTGPADTLARLGGDEFVLLTRAADEDEAGRAAQRLVDLFREPLTVAGRAHRVSISVGVTLAAAGTADAPEVLLRQADAALYRAKERGGRGYELFDVADSTAAEQRLVTRELLTRSLEDGHLGLAYQPIVDLDDGAVVGAEALVRLPTHDGRVLLPAEFLSLAQHSGLQAPLDLAVLEHAVAAAGRIAARHHSPPGITCNMSADSLSRSDIAPTVRALLDRHRLPPHLLSLELAQLGTFAERGVLDETSRANLRRLAAAGVQLGLDDIGSVSGALDLLRDLPFAFVKIGRRFVAGLPGRRQDEAIVRAVVDLGAALGVGVRVEGVERPEQAAVLRDLGCRLAQGFLFSAPLGEEEYVRRVESRARRGAARSAR